MPNSRLVTTLGDLSRDQVGWMLAHEHVFANFYEDNDHDAPANIVITRMMRELEAAKAGGITVLVEATAIGGARRPDLCESISRAAGVPLVLATGIFKEPAKTEWVREYGEDLLREWMINELTIHMSESDVRAGWIKLSATDSGVQPHEEILLRAAAGASQATGAVVGSHTVGAALANAELDLFESAGGDPSRFIWIHTQTEPDINEHLAFARRGAWIEYDAINENLSDETYLDWICAVFEAGLGDHLLLSQDRGGYNPAQANGGTMKPYTYLVDAFVPKLRERGIGDDGVNQLLSENPFRAYGR